MMEDALENEDARTQPIDRPWHEYPIGTKALALMGGHWLRIEAGWRWMPCGGTFPRPGGDAVSVVLPAF